MSSRISWNAELVCFYELNLPLPDRSAPSPTCASELRLNAYLADKAKARCIMEARAVDDKYVVAEGAPFKGMERHGVYCRQSPVCKPTRQ